MSSPSQRADSRLPRDVRQATAVLAMMLGGFFLAASAPAQDMPSSPRAYLQRMDADGDGHITEHEYVDYMNRGFAAMDRDGNGVLEGSELPPGARPITLAERRQALRAGFRRQDRNHDGVLDAAELAQPPPTR